MQRVVVVAVRADGVAVGIVIYLEAPVLAESDAAHGLAVHVEQPHAARLLNASPEADPRAVQHAFVRPCVRPWAESVSGQLVFAQRLLVFLGLHGPVRGFGSWRRVWRQFLQPVLELVHAASWMADDVHGDVDGLSAVDRTAVQVVFPDDVAVVGLADDGPDAFIPVGRAGDDPAAVVQFDDRGRVAFVGRGQYGRSVDGAHDGMLHARRVKTCPHGPLEADVLPDDLVCGRPVRFQLFGGHVPVMPFVHDPVLSRLWIVLFEPPVGPQHGLVQRLVQRRVGSGSAVRVRHGPCVAVPADAAHVPAFVDEPVVIRLLGRHDADVPLEGDRRTARLVRRGSGVVFEPPVEPCLLRFDGPTCGLQRVRLFEPCSLHGVAARHVRGPPAVVIRGDVAQAVSGIRVV